MFSMNDRPLPSYRQYQALAVVKEIIRNRGRCWRRCPMRIIRILSRVSSTFLCPNCTPKQNISTSHLMSVASRQFRTDSCSGMESCVVFIVRIRPLLELTRVICLRSEDLRIQFPYCDFGSILFGIVEVLTVVPVSGGETSALYVDGC